MQTEAELIEIAGKKLQEAAELLRMVIGNSADIPLRRELAEIQHDVRHAMAGVRRFQKQKATGR